MKKKVLIIIGIVIVLLVVIYGIIFFVDYNNVSNGKLPIFAIKSDTENYHGLGYTVNVKYYNDTNDIETINMSAFGKTIAGAVFNYDEVNNDTNNDIIIIEDGKIQNENLLDTFLKNADNKEPSTLQINNISNGNTETITLEYVPGENDIKNDTSSENITVNTVAPDKDWTYEDYQKYYGYFQMTKNDKEERFDIYHWGIKRQTTDNTVQVIFYTDYFKFDLLEIPVIFEYNLDSSLYEKTYDLTYHGRKDMGIKQIAKTNQYDNIDYGLYTIAGDVTVTVEQDMVYSLEDALNQKIISVQSILDQAKEDEKYGICETASYNDGGSIEYRYHDYTILKLNKLDGNKDLIIGYPYYDNSQNYIINNEQIQNKSYKDTDEKELQDKYSKISLSIKKDTITKTGATIIISDISEQENTYGEWFRIDKKTNGFWEELKPIDDNYVFTDIAYKIGENHQLEMNTDWSKLYGELEPGEYRIVKELYDNGDIYLAVEFTIE